MVDVGAIRKQWLQLSDKIHALTLRERVILLAMTNTILIIVGILVLLDPLYIDIKDLNKSKREVANETQMLEAEYAEIKIKYTIDPNEQIKNRLIEIESKLRRKDGLIRSKSSQLIPANTMVDLLKDLLLKQKKIELIRFSNIKPEPISWDSKESQMAEAEPEETSDTSELSDEEKILAALMESMTESGGDKTENRGIPKYTDFLLFRHGVVMELEGEFHDIVNYLKDIERLEWKFYWHRVDYEVTEYPKAMVILELQTLGYEEGWLGA